MIHFGDNYSIVFKHHGRGREKHPTSTTCFIYKGETKETRLLVSSARSKPVKYIPVIIENEAVANDYINKNQKKIVLVSKDQENGKYVIITKGDMFSYEEGRHVSLTKALSGIVDKDLRAEAWDAYHCRYDDKFGCNDYSDEPEGC